MITREFDLTIRVPQQDYNDTGIKLVQNDQNVYYFNIRITDGINDIDYSQVERATITFKKKDGNVIQGNLVPADKGYTYKLGTNEIACPGKVVASIQLYGEDGERLTTARFQFEVVADLITPDAVQSESRFPILQQLVADVEQLKQDIVNLQIPDGSIMDVKLSNAAGQIKPRFAAHLTDVAAHGGIYHKNLLHNWDFRNPVNQRGQSSYSAGDYTIDRWRRNNPNILVNINSGYITVSNNDANERHFLQQLEFMVPGDYTISLLLANGDILSESLNVNDSVARGSGGSSVKSLTDGLKTQIGEFSSKPSFKLLIAPGYSFNIVAIKLELGSVSTLANDPPADFGEELRKCQRYLLAHPSATWYRADLVAADAMQFTIPTPVTMRISPSIIVNGEMYIRNMAGVNQTGFIFSQIVRNNAVIITATKSGHGVSDGSLILNNVLFSAEL